MRFPDSKSSPGVKSVLDNLHSDDQTLRTDAELTIAKYLHSLGKISEGCYLVPVPQKKEGKATYTKEICDIVSMVTKAKVLDIVERVPNTKKFFRTASVPKDANIIIFVDDKIQTGKTYEKINDLFDQTLIPLVFAVDYSMLKDLSILDNNGEIVVNSVEGFKNLLHEKCDSQTMLTISPDIFQKGATV